MSRFHFWLTLTWVALTLPTLVWWGDSVMWVSIISIYANIVGHWSAYQAAHAEEILEKKVDNIKGSVEETSNER